MSKISQVKSYFLSPNKCFIPRCKARCCTNAPLPEDFLQYHKSRVQRKIYFALNIGKNDPRDPFNSVLYNTTTNPIMPLGHGPDGKLIYGIPKKLLNELNIKDDKSMKALFDSYNRYGNYCPFITDYGKCSVYEYRPGICREFGTLPDRQNRCSDKSSRLDIAKFWIKEFFNFKETFNLGKNLVKNLFNHS